MQKFLEYWAVARPDPRQPQDDAQHLYSAYKSTVADFENSRMKTHRLLVPQNTGKGWHAVFDPDATERVVALASEIEDRKATLKSIAQDIADFMMLVGSPALNPLIEQLNQARRSVSDAVVKAKTVTKLATNANPRLSPAEIQELPDVLQANLALIKKREDLEPTITNLTEKIEKARAILQRHS